MGAATEPGAAPPAAASAGLGSRRGRMIEVGSGPGPDRHRYRMTALPWSSSWITAGNGKGRGIACGSPGTPRTPPLPQRRRPSRGAPPGGHGAAPQPRGDTEPGPAAPRPPTAQKGPKEQRALPGMEARTVCRGAQTAVPVSDLPELPHSSQILNPKQYTWEMPQTQRFKWDEVWNFPGSQLKCRSEGELLQ
ncbi:myosin IC heavy chain-like [Ammospiza nelsoni]|uniref:myosin IC heavy chain-like n=1 Tax=Ammospiza nelsoni TaxID=2857394 RepID=UPI002869C1F7|nr:myosin IC heavy chain-like [Ammospiza nelsoni]